MQSPELFVGVITLLVAVLGAAFAFRQIGRADRDRRERIERQEDEDILGMGAHQPAGRYGPDAHPRSSKRS